tara:strand:- start:159 stop:692 length:534 start_codon:yes stop_codon:yes gene_type:complete
MKSGKSNRLILGKFNEYGSLSFYYLEMQDSTEEQRIEIESAITLEMKSKNISMNLDVGRTPCSETRKIVSENYMGKNLGKDNPNFGNRWSDEQKRENGRKISEAWKRRLGTISDTQIKSYAIRRPLLCREDVLKIIFKLENEEYIPKKTFESLASEFGCSVSTVQRIRRRARPYDNY